MPSTTVAGTTLQYLDVGAGDPAVVLLHAFPLNAEMWHRQLEPLAGRHRVIAPHLKGFGTSDAPEDPGAYTMESYADELAGVLDAAGVARAVVVGLSMGGYVSFAFLRRPQTRERVAGLVLADTRAEADAPEVAERRQRQQRQVAEEGTGPVVDTMLDTLLCDYTRTHNPSVVQQARQLMDNPPAGFIGSLEAMRHRPDASGELPSITVPTLVVVGEEDGPSPPDVARAMHERIPGSQLAVLARAGHLSNMEQPDAFNRALTTFLSDHF